MSLTRYVALLGALCLLATAPRARADTLRVIVPEADNLQHMAFWVAKSRGFFHEEGVDIVVTVAANPRATLGTLRGGRAEVAVLAAPMALELIASKFPFLVVANLLRNDPAELIVSAAVAADRKLGRDLPVAERLGHMKGLRIGVAPGPVARLRVLFRSNGLDESSVSIVTTPGEAQDDALKDGTVDALYAHTPFLEGALVDQGAVIVVDQSSGEVPALADLQIHVLAVTKKLLDAAPDTVAKLVRAIAHAERSIHEDPKAAVDALCTEFPLRDRKKVEVVVGLYAPAIPIAPTVSVDGLRAALDLYPAHREAPDLTGIELSDYVDSSFASNEPRADKPVTTSSGSSIGYAAALVVVAAAAGALILRRRKART